MKSTNKNPAEVLGFEMFLQQKGIIPKTIARHKREVNKYEKWLSESKDKETQNATKKDLLDYLKHIKDSRQLSNATQNSILQKLKNYYTFLAKQYRINNITHLIKIRGAERKHLTPIFTPDELDLLCDAYYYHIQEYKPTRKELYFYPDHETLLSGYYIALTLMAYQALQINEIENLTACDFDMRKATVTINPSRTGAKRTLTLEASQIGVLIQHFADQTDPPLMPNRNHFERLNTTLKKLHPKFKSFRQLRTSKITHWLKLHGLRKAQHLAGHKNITSTEKYLTGDFETLQNDLDNFHPLN
jgi:integrase/recombinase XerD